jgi:hypothetical protein
MKVSVIIADEAVPRCFPQPAAEHFTRQYGHGHWSGHVTERGALRGIRTSRVLVVRMTPALSAAAAVPEAGAIDVKYFVGARRPLT